MNVRLTIVFLSLCIVYCIYSPLGYNNASQTNHELTIQLVLMTCVQYKIDISYGNLNCSTIPNSYVHFYTFYRNDYNHIVYYGLCIRVNRLDKTG